MLPISPAKLHGPLQHQTSYCASPIPHARRPSESNDRKHTARSYQFAHAANAGFGIDVMKHRDRRHHIERSEFQRKREKVADNKSGPVSSALVRSSSTNARVIGVQTDDIQTPVGEVERQQTIAAPNIESGSSLRWDRLQHYSVIVNIQVPSGLIARHTKSLPASEERVWTKPAQP